MRVLGLRGLAGIAAVCLGLPLHCGAGDALAQAQEPAPRFRENNRVCGTLARRYEEMQRTVTPRQLNFLLFDAAERGCGTLATAFLDAGATVEARDRFGNTALIRAAAAGHEDLVSFLLGRGSAINQRNLAGSTALMQAVKGSRREAVKVLLEAGADADALNGEGVTPLAAAAFNGNRKLVSVLLDHGVDPDVADRSGKGPIVYAAARGFTGIVDALLDAGVDVNRRYEHGLTALMWAAGHADDVPEAEGVATVRLLVERGAGIDLADDRGRTALMIAAQRGHPEVVRYLLGQGADASLRDAEGAAVVDLAEGDAVRTALQGKQEK